MCRGCGALSPDAPATTGKARGMEQYFICSRNYDECMYRRVVDGVKGQQKSCPVKYMVYRDDRPEELKQLDALYIEDFLCVMHPVINANNNLKKS